MNILSNNWHCYSNVPLKKNVIQKALDAIGLKYIFVLCLFLSSPHSTSSHSSSSLLASSCSTPYPRTRHYQGPVPVRKTLQRTLLISWQKAHQTELSVGSVTDTETEEQYFFFLTKFFFGGGLLFVFFLYYFFN